MQNSFTVLLSFGDMFDIGDKTLIIKTMSKWALLSGGVNKK